MKKIAIMALLAVAMSMPTASSSSQGDQVINKAVDMALNGDPQGAWRILERSSIDGREKLELLKLFRELFPGFEQVRRSIPISQGARK